MARKGFGGLAQDGIEDCARPEKPAADDAEDCGSPAPAGRTAAANRKLYSIRSPPMLAQVSDGTIYFGRTKQGQPPSWLQECLSRITLGQVLFFQYVSFVKISHSNESIYQSWPRHNVGHPYSSPEASPMSVTGWPRWMLLSTAVAITATFIALPAVRLAYLALQRRVALPAVAAAVVPHFTRSTPARVGVTHGLCLVGPVRAGDPAAARIPCTATCPATSS